MTRFNEEVERAAISYLGELVSNLRLDAGQDLVKMMRKEKAIDDFQAIRKCCMKIEILESIEQEVMALLAFASLEKRGEVANG